MYRDRAVRAALPMTRDAGAAEDVAQDAFVTAWHKLPALREPDRFGSWLVGIVRNQARSRRRHLSRHCPDASAVADFDLSEFESANPTPLDRVLASEADIEVREAVSALPADQRDVVARYYLRHQTTRQIAEELSLTEIAVRKRLSRGRTALRTKLERAVAAAFVVAVLETITSSAAAAATGTAAASTSAGKATTATMWTAVAAAATAAAVLIAVALTLPAETARASSTTSTENPSSTAVPDRAATSGDAWRAPRGHVEMGNLATGDDAIPRYRPGGVQFASASDGLGKSDATRHGSNTASNTSRDDADTELSHGPGVIWRSNHKRTPTGKRPLMRPPPIAPPPPWSPAYDDPSPLWPSGAPSSTTVKAPSSPALGKLSDADVAGF